MTEPQQPDVLGQGIATSGETKPQRSMLISTRYVRGLSGKVILLQNNIPALVNAGWQVSLLVEKADPALTDPLGARVISMSGPAFSKNHKLNRFNRRHVRLAESGEFDLVVSHGETLQQDILHVHNCRHMEYELIRGEVLRPGRKYAADIQAKQLGEQRFRLVVANSGLMKDDLMSRYGIDESRIRVVYPGYDSARFRPGISTPESRELRGRFARSDQYLIGLITSGKLDQRGADLLIQACAQLPAELRSACQLLIVARDDFSRYQQQAQAAGIASQVHFMAPRNDVENLYRALDVYVNPARVETFGMALLEAMASGTPAITTLGKVGAAELFNAEMQHILMAQASADALCQSLQTLLRDESSLARHSGLCARAALPHDWSSNTRQHLRIYDEVFQAKQQTMMDADKAHNASVAP